MKRAFKHIWIVALAAALCVAFAGTAFAYFTDYVKASGQKEITLGYDTTVHEEPNGKNKKITVENTGATEAFVRVHLFGAASQPGIDVDVKPGDGWKRTSDDTNPGVQLWEYTEVLQPGESTSELKVDVSTNDSATYPIDQFDITVVEQCSPVAYSGNNAYAYNWTAKEEVA